MRKVNTRKLAGILAAALLGGSALAAPVVTGLKVKAIPPWGVALDYTVRGATAADASLQLDVTATDGTRTYYAESLFGATTRAKGAHRVYWNMAADGVAPIATNGIAVSYRKGRYCVIDLSAGADAKAWPVSYLPSVPTGGWTDEYKTRKIALRRIDAPSGVYYAGVFEVTEAQWANVMGGGWSPSTRPKAAVSYNAIRGDAGTYDWPGSGAVDPTSFMGRLRQKTGLSALDLPSEAEWEYAARAGVTTKWPCGDVETGPGDCLGDYAWYKANSGDAAHPVGTRRANAWGLYDVHGNVWEWCLERLSSIDDRRVLRGGAYDCDASLCAFAFRYSINPSIGSSCYGFRLFCRRGSN